MIDPKLLKYMDEDIIEKSKTHKIEITSNGWCFYPKEYKDYNDFKTTYLQNTFVIELLFKRLYLLKTLSQYPTNPLNKHDLDLNTIGIITNAQKRISMVIDFDNSCVKVQILSIIEVLKIMIPSDRLDLYKRLNYYL